MMPDLNKVNEVTHPVVNHVTPSPIQYANLRPTFSTVKNEESSPVHAEASPVADASPSKRVKDEYDEMHSPSPSKQDNYDDPTSDAPSKKFGFGMKSTNVANKNKLETVFNSNEDDLNNEDEPKKKLSRLNDANEKKETPTVEDKRKLIKNLIEKIPTVKDELFAFPLKWDIVDQALVDKRIKPWVNKKIFEYIGEEEETLVDFICSKVLSKCSAKRILEDVAMVLDEESEVFVVKMWRLLIYETEAKCLGLVK